MIVLYKKEPVTIVRLNLIKSEYLNKPIVNQVKIRYKDGSTEYVDSREIVWEPDQTISYETK